MSIWKTLAEAAIDKIDDEQNLSMGEKAERARDAQVQRISFLVRSYLDVKKPGVSSSSTKQAQIRVVAQWIYDEQLRSSGGDHRPIDAWLGKLEKCKAAERIKLLEEEMKGPIAAQVRFLMVA